LIPVGSLLYALFAVSFGTGKKVDECDSSSNQPKDL